MILFLTILAGAVFIITALNVFVWPRPAAGSSTISSDSEANVSVLIPARNEELNLGPCLDRLVGQPAIKEILVYDDHSSDRTGEILAAYALRHRFIRAVKVSDLKDGWCGKTYACSRLASEAKGDWLLFLDADVRLAENALGVMLEETCRRGLDFLSCWPRLLAESPGERLLMPMLNFAVFSIFPVPLMLLKDRRFTSQPSLGLAHGACMFFRKTEYAAFGGHERVKAELFEDTRIAQLWRSDERSGLCLDGWELLSIRMYSSIREIFFGFQKNFYPAFKSDLSFAGFLAFHFLTFLLPFILIFVHPARAIIPAGIVLASRFLLKLRFGDTLLSVLLFPVAEIFLLLVAISSWWRCWTGKGVGWKGRNYRQLPKGVKQ